MKTIILLFMTAAFLAQAADPKTEPKLPVLDQQDVQLLQSILEDPSIAQVKADIQSAQMLLGALTAAVNAKQEAQKLKGHQISPARRRPAES
jgi:hypothetical protein